MERITAISSIISAVRGNIELTGIPLCPYLLNSKGEGKTFPLLLNWVRSTLTGMGWPANFVRVGLGSNVSMCETPPDM